MNKISTRIATLTIAAASLFSFTASTANTASAATAPGSCDFGVPTVSGFSCHDSDDLNVKAGSAHTDNGIISDDLDIDWYLNSNNRFVSIRGSLLLDAGAVGVATIRVVCRDAAGANMGSRSRTITSDNSFHLGLSKDASLDCSGASLDHVDVTVTHQAFSGVQTQTRSAFLGGN